MFTITLDKTLPLIIDLEFWLSRMYKDGCLDDETTVTLQLFSDTTLLDDKAFYYDDEFTYIS